MRHVNNSPSLRKALVAATVAVVLLGGACSKSSNDKKTSTPTTKAAAQVTIDGQTIVDRGRKSVSGTAPLKIEDNYFEPNVLTAAPGSTVTLTINNTGKALHNFSEAADAIDHDLQPGASFTATVHIPQSGPLTFFCKYHKDEAGMVGAFNLT